MSDVVRMPPRGRYYAWEAGQLAGVSGQKMGQWARRGYIRSSITPSTPRIYSFQDVAEAMVVHELLERGVRHRDILRAIRQVDDLYGDWPLTEAPLGTIPGRGRTRLVLDQPEGVYDVGERGWQQVIEHDNVDLIRRRLRSWGWEARTLCDL